MLQVLYYARKELCLQIEIEDDTIIRISFCDHALNHVVEGDFQAEIIQQLESWFCGKRLDIDLAFFATGTPFQLKVWEETMRIPYGKTISYAEIAKRIGRENAVRAVGAALRANPVPLLIPCHRVIGSNGNLTGYAGSIPVKALLLNLEQQYSSEK